MAVVIVVSKLRVGSRVQSAAEVHAHSALTTLHLPLNILACGVCVWLCWDRTGVQNLDSHPVTVQSGVGTVARASGEWILLPALGVAPQHRITTVYTLNAYIVSVINIHNETATIKKPTATVPHWFVSYLCDGEGILSSPPRPSHVDPVAVRLAVGRLVVSLHHRRRSMHRIQLALGLGDGLIGGVVLCGRGRAALDPREGRDEESGAQIAKQRHRRYGATLQQPTQTGGQGVRSKMGVRRA